MRPLTVIYTTARREPKVEWFFDSLSRQIAADSIINIILVDTYADDVERQNDICAKFNAAFSLERLDELILSEIREGNLLANGCQIKLHHVAPKPTIWQGKHRITKTDWWAKASALNTGLILCETEWVSFADDRSVLSLNWLERINLAMEEPMYAVCGAYEKRANLEVENGEVIGGEVLGIDTRTPGLYDFQSWYGGHGALPLEWCLMVNGFAELTDSLGSEDSMFGVTLRNNNLPIKYDSEMRIIEDRTPGKIDGALKRADKNPHLGQQAKSWEIVRRFKGQKTSMNEYDLRNLRDRVLLNNESLDSLPPIGSRFDFYDGQYIGDME